MKRYLGTLLLLVITMTIMVTEATAYTFTINDVSVSEDAGTTTAATLLENPLWYAAKWGGFNRLNSNNKPDLNSEWDENGDGVPDTYFYVVNPLKFVHQLNQAFINILSRKNVGDLNTVGDLNDDGDVNLVDAILGLKILSGQIPTGMRDDYATSGADVNGDGKIGMEEVIYINEKNSGIK